MDDGSETCICSFNCTIFTGFALAGLYLLELIFALSYIIIGLQSANLSDRMLVGAGFYMLSLIAAKIYFRDSQWYYRIVLKALSALSFVWISISIDFREGKNNPINAYAVATLIFIILIQLFQLFEFIAYKNS